MSPPGRRAAKFCPSRVAVLGKDLHFGHGDPLQGAVHVGASRVLHPGDLLHHVHPLHHLPEDGVAPAVETGKIGMLIYDLGH